VPINYKRRIFRPARLSSFGLARPLRRVTLTVLAGAFAVSGGLWATLGPSQAPASSVSVGRITANSAEVSVIDGGTLRLHDRVVQLAGVQPPARGTPCVTGDGLSLDCATAAANALAGLVAGASVDCEWHGAGQAGRPLAVCSAYGRELNQAIVMAGWAGGDTAIPRLRDAEKKARADHRGLWVNRRTGDENH
jgi:endonuclease YncB( thermonuclease family)